MNRIVLPENVEDDRGHFAKVQPVLPVNEAGFGSALLGDKERGLYASGPGYYAQKIDYAAYATPTDLFALRNPVGSGKVLVPRIMGIATQSTAAALVKYFWYRRSALDTGGTPTDLVAVPYDTDFDPAVGVARVYGAAPVIVDAAAPIINLHWGTSAVLTAAPTNLNSSGFSFSWAPNAIDYVSPPIVRPGQELVMNLAGAALPAGFNGVCQLMWAEYDIPGD